MLNKPFFQFSLGIFRGEGQKIELAGVFDYLLCQVGLWCRKGCREVGNRLPSRP